MLSRVIKWVILHKHLNSALFSQDGQNCNFNILVFPLLQDSFSPIYFETCYMTSGVFHIFLFQLRLQDYKSVTEVNLQMALWLRFVFCSLIALRVINSPFSLVFTQCTPRVEKSLAPSPGSPQTAAWHKMTSTFHSTLCLHCSSLTVGVVALRLSVARFWPNILKAV